MKITVAGAGTWGTALGRILALKNLDVCIWSRFQEELKTSESWRCGDSRFCFLHNRNQHSGNRCGLSDYGSPICIYKRNNQRLCTVC